MCVDIEIRSGGSMDDYCVKVIIYDLTMNDNEGTIRSVRDIYHANDYPTAVSLLPKFLLNKQQEILP